MKPTYALSIVVLMLVGFTNTAFAKLPALSDEAKAKAAEAAAKTAWTGKVDNYLLCKSQDKTAAHYYKTNKTAKPAGATPACADPGPFVYPLPAVAATTPAASPAAPTVASAAATTKPAAAAAPAKKP